MSDIEMKDLSESVGSVNIAFEEFKKANDVRLSEIESKGSADPILEEKLSKIETDIDKHQEKLDAFQLSQKRQSRIVTDADGSEIDLDKKAQDWANQVSKNNGQHKTDYNHSELNNYRSTFIDYLRKGDQMMGSTELKSLSVGSDPDGGYVVHPDLNGQIVTQVYESSPMRAYASIQTISTDALEGLFDLGEAASGWVGEVDARPVTATPQLGKWRIPTHELYAKPTATQKLLDDAEINMEAWLASKVAEKFARAENTAFVTGVGTSSPVGFLTYPDGTTIPSTIEQLDTGVNGAFAADPSGGDVLIDAIYALKAPYRANATWFMNRATVKLARKIADTTGEYMWAPGIANGEPATLMGYPIASFEDMPNPATGSLSIAFGDMRAAYQIVDRIGIRTLRDPYSAKPYVEFYTTKRVGGDVVNFEALKIINFKA